MLHYCTLQPSSGVCCGMLNVSCIQSSYIQIKRLKESVYILYSDRLITKLSAVVLIRKEKTMNFWFHGDGIRDANAWKAQ